MKREIRERIEKAPPIRPRGRQPRNGFACGHPYWNQEPDQCDDCLRRLYFRVMGLRSYERRNPRVRFERARRLREAIRSIIGRVSCTRFGHAIARE